MKLLNLAIKPTALTFGAVGVLLASSSVFAQDAQQQQSLNEDSQAEIMIEEDAPEVTVRKPAPQVEIDQAQPEVQVEAGEPEVSVSQAEPQVSVDQPEPEVYIEQTEPEVVVQEAEPQVDVQTEEPQVTINPAGQPEVQIIDGEEQASVEQDQMETAEATQSLETMELEQLQGKTVVTALGEDLGDVGDIVYDPQSGEAGFVVSVGGFFGIGDDQVFVPAKEASLNENQEIVWQTSMSGEEIQQYSSYQEEQYQSASEQFNTLSEIRGAS